MDLDWNEGRVLAVKNFSSLTPYVLQFLTEWKRVNPIFMGVLFHTLLFYTMFPFGLRCIVVIDKDSKWFKNKAMLYPTVFICF